VCAVDLRGLLTFANPAAQRLLGWPESELLGRDLHEIGHPHRESTCPILDVARTHSSYQSDDDCLRRRDGTLLAVSLTASPLADGSSEGAVLAFQDITERKRRIEADRFLARASESFSELLDYELVLARVASLCVPELADACTVLVGEENQGFARISVGLSGGDDPPIVEHLAAGRFLAEEMQLETHEIAPAALREIVGRDWADRGPHASLSVTLRSGGRPIGRLILLTRQPRRPPDPLVACELAHRAAMAIENAILYREAQQAVRVRDEFLSIASHELRTPLTPLRLQLGDLLERARSMANQPTEKLTARLESASRQVDRMSRLVSNLLDVSRIAAGRVVLERELVDLVALVAEVLDRSEPEVQRAGYRVDFEGEGPLVGPWDRMRIDQVITNLLSNALKYGEGKPIEISARQKDGAAVLTVRDHGIGVAPEQIERIFGRFERAVSGRSYGGLGLGLYIVRQFVEAHGGSVKLESRVGEGSTFTVELPLHS
jgi:PAS domain S-box-containing protein